IACIFKSHFYLPTLGGSLRQQGGQSLRNKHSAQIFPDRIFGHHKCPGGSSNRTSRKLTAQYRFHLIHLFRFCHWIFSSRVHLLSSHVSTISKGGSPSV